MESILAKALGPEPNTVAVAQRRDLLERLLARLAHEIRNPLSSLDIHVQLLEEDLAPEAREQHAARLGIIRGELHRLESIMERFLRLTSPSELDLAPVEPRKVITHVCELLRPEAAGREIRIEAELPESLPTIQADSVRLTQALLNLMINALQAIGRKGNLKVAAAADGGSLKIEVSDDGPGIPPEKLPSIFDPYFTTKDEGSGLGLWIAQQIVTAHGGTLSARNGREKGAVFTMLLPVKPAG